MLRRLALVTLLLAANAEAEVVTHRFWIATDTAGTRHQAAFFYVCDTQVELPATATEGDQAWAVDTDKFFVWDGAAWLEIGAGGGGAPATAQYWVGAADATLSAEHNLGALATGLVINTTGTPSAYGGTSCTNQFPRSLSASGAATCASVALGSDVSGALPLANGGLGVDLTGLSVDRVHVTNGAGSMGPYALPDCDDTAGQHLNYNNAAGGGPAFSCGTSSSGGSTPTGTGFRHVTAGAEDAASVLVTLTSATEVAPNQGTTTTVLHGNAAGQASFGSVDLTNDTSSVLPLAKLTDDALANLCLLSGGGGGDPYYDTCPGGGGGLSYAQVAAAALAGF